METKTQKKPQYISYVRYAKNEEPEAPTQDNSKAGKVMIYGLIAYSAALLFTPGWVVGLPIVGTAAAIHGAQKLVEYKNSPKKPKLVINYNR